MAETLTYREACRAAIREAILEGIIPNDKERALAYMEEIAPTFIKK